ncbi:MAG: hypothetical protein J0H17_08150 [Rhizobiales bacterium]|nr:hypothetical protein [Hyphomicrobiales bacterium]
MTSKREDWCIEIRDDNRDGTPEITAKSEYVIRGRNGARHVDQGLPPLKTALANLDDIPATLRDGTVTTLGACVQSLRDAVRDAIDQLEVDIEADQKADAQDAAELARRFGELERLDAAIRRAVAPTQQQQDAAMANSKAIGELRDRQDARARRRHCLADKLRRCQQQKEKEKKQ